MIDPFSDNCTVVTGSHNLGFRASHNNDENMVIVRGHRGLAEAYACHVLDLYDHYAWRFLLKQHPDIFGKPLEGDDKWQERYIAGADAKAPELRFWLAAAAGTASSSGAASPASSRRLRRNASPCGGETGGQHQAGERAKPAKKAAKKKTARKAAKKTKKAAKKTSEEPPGKRREEEAGQRRLPRRRRQEEGGQEARSQETIAPASPCSKQKPRHLRRGPVGRSEPYGLR